MIGDSRDAVWNMADGHQVEERYHGVKSASQYLTMRDGALIAVDVMLPADRALSVYLNIRRVRGKPALSCAHTC